MQFMLSLCIEIGIVLKKYYLEIGQLHDGFKFNYYFQNTSRISFLFKYLFPHEEGRTISTNYVVVVYDAMS